MQWDDSGFLLSKNKYKENSVIAEFYSLNHGKCSGIIYGGTSRKIKNYLQLGNKLSINYKSKNQSNFGYFKIEIQEPVSPYFFDDKGKIITLISSVNLLKLLTPELQKNTNIYNLFSNLTKSMKNNNETYIFDYLLWEISFLKEIGFDLNLTNHYTEKLNNNDISMIKIDNELTKVPNFLINKNFINIKKELIFYALKFIGNYIYKQILKPNNLNTITFRNNLIDLYKS